MDGMGKSGADYERYRMNKIESGQLYQDFIIDLFANVLGMPISVYGSRAYQMAVGESRQGVEIKHDEKYATTGNLWIEVAEKARPRVGPYAASGIDRNDNTWLYIIGNYDIVFVFAKQLLRLLAQTGRYIVRENNTKTSRGFLLPDKDARKYAAIILAPNKDSVVQKFVGDLQATGRELHATLQCAPDQLLLFE